MIQMAIDGSSNDISLSIFSDRELVYDLFIDSQNTHSKILVDIFDCALKALSLELNKIDNIYCCVGPGKYTSLRVTLSTLKGMFFDKTDCVYGVNLLDLIASAKRETPGNFRVVYEASCSKTYFADYKKDNDALKRGDILSASKEEALSSPATYVYKKKGSLTKNIFDIDKNYIKKISLMDLVPIY